MCSFGSQYMLFVCLTFCCLCCWVCWATGPTCGCYHVYECCGAVYECVKARTVSFFLKGHRCLYVWLSYLCFLWMAMTRWLLGCPDIALVCLQFCSVPDTIAFYSVGRHHWASFVASYANSLIPVLWNFDKLASVLDFYWRSFFSPQCYLASDSDEEGLSSLSCSVHRCFCAHLCRRYEYLVDHCRPGYMSPHLNIQVLELPLTPWTEHQVTFIASETCFFLTLCMEISLNLNCCLCCMVWVWIDMFLSSCFLGAVDMQDWQLHTIGFRPLRDGATWWKSFID